MWSLEGIHCHRLSGLELMEIRSLAVKCCCILCGTLWGEGVSGLEKGLKRVELTMVGKASGVSSSVGRGSDGMAGISDGGSDGVSGVGDGGGDGVSGVGSASRPRQQHGLPRHQGKDPGRAGGQHGEVQGEGGAGGEHSLLVRHNCQGLHADE